MLFSKEQALRYCKDALAFYEIKSKPMNNESPQDCDPLCMDRSKNK